MENKIKEFSKEEFSKFIAGIVKTYKDKMEYCSVQMPVFSKPFIEEEEQFTDFNEWISSRPICVQEAHKKYGFTPKTIFLIEGEELYFIGYDEYKDGSVGVIVSKVNPFDDYERAVEESEHICPDCLNIKQ